VSEQDQDIRFGPKSPSARRLQRRTMGQRRRPGLWALVLAWLATSCQPSLKPSFFADRVGFFFSRWPLPYNGAWKAVVLLTDRVGLYDVRRILDDAAPMTVRQC